jgi:hypothetical protein
LYKIINKKKKVMTALADIVGYGLFAPLRLFGKEPAIPVDPAAILIIRTAYIGDVVMTLPILKPLKQRFPNSRITFLTA